MGANTMSGAIEITKPGEDGDSAYLRLYGTQTRPCDFRRWFTVISRGDICFETDEEIGATIAEYIAEGMTVDEAFATHCPGYVGPGEFSVRWTRELRAIAAPAPVVDETLSVVSVTTPLSRL